MNIEAYDIDSLRKLVRSLQNENTALKSQLQKANIPYEEISHFEERIENLENYDLDQGERIIAPEYITDDMAKRYFAMFWGRQDVFAKRGKNGGYFPQCNNRWNDSLCPRKRGEKALCDECENTQWTPLELWRIKEHLKGTKEDGSDVLGIYPLLADGTCRFIVFDFDNHEKGAEATDYANTDNEWHAEVEALRKMCEQNGIKPLVERSRSGRGAHVWIFFKRPISASLARNFGFPISYMEIAHAECMKEVFKAIANTQEGVLFHCTAGKDRTGVVSAILLALVGVSDEDIIYDYTVSREFNRLRLEEFLKEHPEIDREIVLANEKSMRIFLETLREKHNSVEQYLLDIGVTSNEIQRLKNKLIQ